MKNLVELLIGGKQGRIWSGEGWDPLHGRAFTPGRGKPPDRSKKAGGLSREGERQWRWKRGGQDRTESSYTRRSGGRRRGRRQQIGKKQTRPRWKGKRKKLGGEEGGDYSILAKSERRDWRPQKFGIKAQHRPTNDCDAGEGVRVERREGVWLGIEGGGAERLQERDRTRVEGGWRFPGV